MYIQKKGRLRKENKTQINRQDSNKKFGMYNHIIDNEHKRKKTKNSMHSKHEL